MKNPRQYDVVLRQIAIRKGRVARGLKTWDPADVSAELEVIDAGGKRVTATRVLAGGLLAGPAGAIVGALVQKDTSRVVVTVSLSGGDVERVELPGKDLDTAKTFLANLEALQAAS